APLSAMFAPDVSGIPTIATTSSPATIAAKPIARLAPVLYAPIVYDVNKRICACALLGYLRIERNTRPVTQQMCAASGARRRKNDSRVHLGMYARALRPAAHPPQGRDDNHT